MELTIDFGSDDGGKAKVALDEKLGNVSKVIGDDAKVNFELSKKSNGVYKIKVTMPLILARLPRKYPQFALGSSQSAQSHLLTVNSGIERRHLTTHSTGARDSVAFIILPSIMLNGFRPRPVNSSVKLLISFCHFCLNSQKQNRRANRN